ncbi:MAG: YiiD C-terminal domain-containing protein [Bdellovibrionales bacterium]|nr:YiiD C-terminal domain-containing protein [Bdellovibrionales bacterium]
MSKVTPLSASELTHHFHKKIPITKLIGVQVLEVSARKACLFAPLLPNINHVNTLFGGSLYSVAALSCYALFLALSREAGGLSDKLVIQDGNIKYLFPVDSDFISEAQLENEGELDRFLSGLKKHGKARIRLAATLQCQTKICAKFEGSYVFKEKAPLNS